VTNVAHLLDQLHPSPAILGTSVVDRAELRAGAAAVASQVEALGAGPGQRVVLAASRTGETVAGLFGVLAAGAAVVFVPPDLDPVAANATFDRLSPRAILMDPARPPRWAARATPFTGRGESASWAPRTVSAEDGAFVFTTSGSTGPAKAVVQSHGSVARFLDWAVPHFGMDRDDRVAALAPWSFDIALLDILGAVASGASLVLLPDEAFLFGRELRAEVERWRVSFWQSVPSLWSLIPDLPGRDGGLGSLRTILMTGEAAKAEELEKAHRMAPSARIWNVYGATECNDVSTYLVTPADIDAGRPLPIGRPVPGARLHLEGAEGGHGVGEIVAEASTLMTGYLGDPEGTAEKLVTSADGQWPGVAYRTGDLGRRGPDGQIRLVGRVDRQVKVTGHAVHLDEVEWAAAAGLGVEAAAVLSHGEICLVVETGASPLDEDQVRAWCARNLPRPAHPRHVRLVYRLPRGATGKIDRRQLTEREGVSHAS
jgi:amino acid adenylation domain-containing protein